MSGFYNKDTIMMKYEKIPARMMKAIMLYIVEGRPMGGFLNAVFSNDLTQSIYKADSENIVLLPLYVEFVHWEIPSNSHGSTEIMKEWMHKQHAIHKSTDGHLTDFSRSCIFYEMYREYLQDLEKKTGLHGK